MKFLTRALIAGALIGAVSSCLAVGWVKILKDTPAEAFEEDDLHMFLDNAKRTVEAEGEPELVTWNNPATGAGGSFKVMGPVKSKSGAPCKRVHLSIYAKSRAEKGSTAVVCQDADKRWRLGGQL